MIRSDFIAQSLPQITGALIAGGADMSQPEAITRQAHKVANELADAVEAEGEAPWQA
jgi:hypothetical protein